MSEDIAARIEFLFGQSKRRLRRFAPRCEKERDCAGIVRRTVLAELRLDRRRLIFTAACTQPFSERPLVFWKRIYLRALCRASTASATLFLASSIFPCSRS